MAIQTRKLQAAFEFLSVICDDVSDTMPVRQALALVSVALRQQRDGFAELKGVGDDTKSVPAAVSRDLQMLGSVGRSDGKPGHDLVTVDMGALKPEGGRHRPDLRRKPYVLTKKGKAIIEKLMEAV